MPITTAADGILKYYFTDFQREVDRIFHVNPLQRIQLKEHAKFASKDKSKNILMSSDAISLGTLRVYYL